MHGTKDVYNHAKNGAIDIETPLDIFNMQMLRKKSFYETAKTWDFFLQDFKIPVILFPETFLAAPILF